jgi:dephospho-CoA kinase
MIIGLTGTICAGKNFVAGLLEELGIPCLDIDKLGHTALEAEKSAVLARFDPTGTHILFPDGKIDRKELGRLVFGKPAELAALEGIVHPAVNRMTDEWIASRNGKFHDPSANVALNAALLHKTPFFQELDALFLVDAPLWTRLLRAKRRDVLPWGAILHRFSSQKNFRAQYLQERADIYIIRNCGFLQRGAETRRKKLVNRIEKILSGLGIRQG